jgi:CDP-diacylglycerol--serine O-phosphatidyltransferase
MNKETNGEVTKPHRGIYLLPNLFTTAALFAGFYAIVAAMKGQYDAAAAAVFIAMVLDGLDGRVARLTNTQSEFGAEYDSLSDMVSFGVAPALVMYEWALHSMGRLGWLAAFIYTVGAALRLARFNTQIGKVDKRYFVGLASPASAAVVVGFVWIAGDLGLSPKAGDWAAWVITVTCGLLMVSNVRYYSFKTIDFKGKVPFFFLLVAVLIIVLITYDPPKVLFLVFTGYALSGLVITLWLLLRRRRQRKAGAVVEGDGAEDGG